MNDIPTIEELLKKDKLDPTTALNILIGAAQVSFDKPHFNDLDRQLLSKALKCFEDKVEMGKNFMIKVN